MNEKDMRQLDEDEVTDQEQEVTEDQEQPEKAEETPEVISEDSEPEKTITIPVLVASQEDKEPEVMSDPTALDDLPLKKLYQFNWDCGPMGKIEGLFVAADDEIQAVIGEEVYFGNALGENSHIRGVLKAEHLTVKSEDQGLLEEMVRVMGSMTISGYNPLDYYQG